ncbi:MAG: hypothetical protein WC728_03765 [Elusimicrobiota bacterium]
MAGFEIKFEAVDEASPTIQRLSKQLLEAAQRSDRFAGQVVAATANADQGFKKLPQSANAAAQSMSAVQSAAGQLLNQLAGFATVAGIAAFFKSSAESALSEEEALRRLQFAVEATGGSFGREKDRVLAFAQEQQVLTRFSDTQTYETMGRLVRVTGDVGQAMQATRLAFGLASASGKDLGGIMELLGPILNGDATRLRTLKNEFGAFIGNASTAQEVIDALSHRFLGAAEAESGYAKQLGSLRNRLDDFKEIVGAGVLPVFKLFLDALLKGAQFAEILSTAIVFNLGGKAFAILQQTFRGWVAIFKGEWDKLPQIAEETNQQLKDIEDTTSKSLLDIHQRYTQSRQEQAESQAAKEIELKARVTQKSIEEARKEAEAKERYAKEAQDFIFRIENERLELTGRTVEANIAQYQREALEREATLRKMAQDGRITWSQYEQAVADAQQVAAIKSQQARDAVNQNLIAMRQTAEAVGSVLENRFATAFSGMALEGKSFAESMKGIWQEIAKVAIEELTRIAVKAAITQAIVSAATSGSGGGGLFGLFGGAAAGAGGAGAGGGSGTGTGAGMGVGTGTAAGASAAGFNWGSLGELGLAGGFAYMMYAMSQGPQGPARKMFGGLEQTMTSVDKWQPFKSTFKFQEGGIVEEPTLGILAEKSKPEAVIPLERLGEFVPLGSPAPAVVEVNVTQNNTFNIPGGGVSEDQVRTMMRRMAEATRSGAAEGAELVKSILARQGKVSREAV